MSKESIYLCLKCVDWNWSFSSISLRCIYMAFASSTLCGRPGVTERTFKWSSWTSDSTSRGKSHLSGRITKSITLKTFTYSVHYNTGFQQGLWNVTCTLKQLAWTVTKDCELLWRATLLQPDQYNLIYYLFRASGTSDYNDNVRQYNCIADIHNSRQWQQ